MGEINKDSLKIALMTEFPHGHLTASALLSILVGDGNTEIYVMDADGGNPQNLTNHHPMVTLILHGLTLLFQFLPPAKSLQCGAGSNRLTDNCHY